MKISKGIRNSWRTWSMVIAMILIWAVFQYVTDGAFLQPRNISNLFRQMSVTGFLAVGMVLIIVSGHIDLSVGSVVCFLGVCLTMILQKTGSPESALAMTLAMGIGISAIQGWFVSYQKVPSFIVTLAGMMIFRGLSMGVTSGMTIPLEKSWIKSFGSAYVAPSLGWTLAVCAVAAMIASQILSRSKSVRNGLPVADLGSFFWQIAMAVFIVLIFTWTMNSYEGVPFPVLLLIVLAASFHFLATRTVFGRHVYAVGGSAEAAFLSGIHVKRVVLANYMLMGFLTTIGAFVLTARVESAQPDAGQLLELDAVASCVIGGTSLMGGKGSIGGAILGALIMESLNNGMSLANMEAFWQYIVKGLVLVGAVWLDVKSQVSK